MPRVRSRPLRLIYALVLGLSVPLVLITMWILVPAPNTLLLPLAVAAPELSPLLLVFGIVLAALSGAYARDLHTARLALVLSLVAAALCLGPILQLPGTVRRFDASMKRAGVPLQGGSLHFADFIRLPRQFPSRLIRGVPFITRGNRSLLLDIYEPPAREGTFPIVLQIYGGAWQRGSPADDRWFATYFAAHGFCVVTPDYRHAPLWRWPAQIDDVRAALEWTIEHAREFNGDPARIVLLGRSSGAQLALIAAYQEPRRPSVRGVVSYYGPVDLAEGWRHPPRPDPLHVRGILEAYLGGTPSQASQSYRDASPVTYAARTVPPTLLIYGGRDHVVDPRFGRELDRSLAQAGNRSVLLEIPWSEHAFDAIPNGLGGQIALSYTEQFIRAITR